MSISLFASNDINKLSSFISHHIQEQYGQLDPFTPIHIVTQTEGMNVWLKTKIAEHLGISANIQFHSPQQIIQIIYEKTGGSKVEYYSRESIQWILFEELKNAEFLSQPSFQIIKDYCHNDDRKRLGLAGELADLFDQYTIYRFDLIEKWNQSNDPITDFQEYLWKRLKIILKEQLNDKTLIRTHILDQLKNSVDQNLKNSLSDIGHLYFFGLSIFTPYHMEIFKGLSEQLQLKFYFLNPCPSQYWYEDKPDKSIRWLEKMNIPHAKSLGNNLLTDWGRVIQESFYLFLDCDEAVNSYQDAEMPIKNPNSLLGKIQHQIINNEVQVSEKFTSKDIEDGSLNIHSNYTKAREVESLYNFLVSLTEKDQSLTGKDIIVSCDIDEYASYIQAIFDTAPYQFKYTIADSAYVQGDNPIQALKFFITLNEENFNAEEVFQLLEFTSVKNKFGIQNTDLIKTIIKKALFRFGMTGKKEDDSFLFSLQHAIQKIIYGITIRTEDTYKDFYPLDILEGLDSMEGIRFCLFAEKLMMLIKEREQSRKISDWSVYVERVMEELIFKVEEGDESVLRYQDMLIKNLSKYYCISEQSQEPISYQLFSTNFISLIGKEKREKRFVSHGITFCSYIPMRSLPFKVVCMLGMDFDKFPRKDLKLSFSHIDGQFRSGSAIIKSKRRRGDRNIRDNDKHLFLENLMSAQEYLYLSYIGNSAKDNATIPPSVFIDELINYISENSNQPDEIRKKIITKHPLHSFSKKYNSENPRLINYLIAENIQIDSQKGNAISITPDQPIDLYKLIKFFRNPIEYFYRNILGIYFEKENAVLPVTESFEMNFLDEWKLKNLFLEQPTPINTRKLIIKGEIPPANMGTALSELVLADINPLLNQIQEERKNLENNPVEIHLKIKPEIELKGRIENVYGNKLIAYTLSGSKSKRKDSIEHVINYLCLIASGMEITPIFILLNGNKVSSNQINQNTAIQYLETLVNLFIKGHKEVLPLFLEFDIPPTKLPPLDNEQAFKDFALDRFQIIEASIRNSRGEYAFKDEYVLNLIRNKYFETEEHIVELFRNTSIVYNIIKSVYKSNML